MSDNKDLTILLTLWDRVACTYRWMEYANKVKWPFKVLIADGGSDNSVAEVLADPANYPNVDYEYIRYPYDETPTHYYAKVEDALARIETPFVVMADNDDFFLVDALLRSLDFLKNHADFSSCRGLIGGFKITPNADYGELSNIYGEDVSFVRQVYKDKPTLEDTAIERVNNFFSSYRATWYDVFRTEQTRKSFQLLRELDTQDLILSQYIPMVLGVIAGKVQIEPYLYLLRQFDGPGSCDQSEFQRADLFDRMLLETWSSDFKGFVEGLAAALAEKDEIPIDEARREIKQNYRSFIAPHLVYYLSGSYLPGAVPPRSVRLGRKIMPYMGPVGSALRKLYLSGQKKVKGRPESQYIPATQLSESDNDFKLIHDFLSTPPHSIRCPAPNTVKRQLEV